VNVLANPTVLAILWLAATTGISIELYNPGLIFPGVFGVICLVIALAMSQVIPVNTAAVVLLAVGALLVGAELFTGTLLLGVLGVLAMVLGAVYLVNVSEAPGLTVAMEFIVPTAVLLGVFLLIVASVGYRVMRKKSVTGAEGLVGRVGRAAEAISSSGRVMVNGELWNACTPQGLIEPGAEVEVVAMRPGLILEVKPRDGGAK
jgi:membrane-bound serine protease (ClpP class)